MHTKQKGKIAELKVELKAAEKGYILSKPTLDCCRYDVIIDTGDRLLKAQIKYGNGVSKKTNGIVVVELRKTHKNNTLYYTIKDIDILLVYIPKIEQILCFPIEKIDGKPSLYIRIENSLFNRGRKSWFAKDFVW